MAAVAGGKGRALKTLDRYLLREWIRILLLAEIGFPLVVIVIDVTDKLGSYLAPVFTIGPLGRHSEVTAAKASGVSFHRLVRPLFVAATATVFFGIVIGDLAPVGTLRRGEL